jgi:antitoxin component YwqK of YwqJK toxin-antitoxin module
MSKGYSSLNPFFLSRKVKFFLKILIFFFLFQFLTSGCSSVSIGGDGRKSTLYLTQENGVIYRTERFPKNFLMKGKGKVNFSCSSPLCTEEELNIPEKKIKDLEKNGSWDEYSLKESDGQSDKAEEDKKFISVLSRKGEYIQNRKEGIWKILREDGSTLMESEYKNDKKNGSETKFGTKGQVIETSFYKEGLREGEYTEKTEKGNLRETGFFSAGKRSGNWTVYYIVDEKGKEMSTETPKEKVECRDDLRNGKYQKFNMDGSKSEESTFLEGKRNGRATFYFPTGEKKSEGLYEPVLPKATTNMDKYNKSLMQCAEMEEGSGGEIVNRKIGEWKEYYPNGNIFSVGKLEGGIKTGEWKYYSSTGVVRAQGKMKNEINFEEGKLFDDQGKLEGEGKLQFSILTLDDKKLEYKHTYKPGIPFKTYKNGKLTLEIFQEKDSILGIKYDDNGQLIGKGPIVNGKENDCWTMKDNSKKYFMMGIENKKMGDMQNCK